MVARGESHRGIFDGSVYGGRLAIEVFTDEEDTVVYIYTMHDLCLALLVRTFGDAI
jgi:hypothetical protein